MIKFFNTKGILLLVLGVAILLLSACAATVPTERVIEERAMARWNALLSNDFAGAYEYLSPGYRSSVSSLQYQRALLLKRVRWDDAQYIESDCIETTCKVKISLNYTVYGAVPGLKSFNGTQRIEESWLRVGGKWYLVPEE